MTLPDPKNMECLKWILPGDFGYGTHILPREVKQVKMHHVLSCKPVITQLIEHTLHASDALTSSLQYSIEKLLYIPYLCHTTFGQRNNEVQCVDIVSPYNTCRQLSKKCSLEGIFTNCSVDKCNSPLSQFLLMIIYVIQQSEVILYIS